MFNSFLRVIRIPLHKISKIMLFNNNYCSIYLKRKDLCDFFGFNFFFISINLYSSLIMFDERLEKKEYPILEFDPTNTGMISPNFFIEYAKPPKFCIIPYFLDLIRYLEGIEILKAISQQKSKVTDPNIIYEGKYYNKKFAVMTPGFTSPWAVGNLEYAIAMGCRDFIVFGSSGCLFWKNPEREVIVPSSAIRDEGTSYHYIAPSREVELNKDVQAIVKNHLKVNRIKFSEGKTWTTDAFYRETIARVNSHKSEGAIAVEMEASALVSAAKFRQVNLGYFLLGSDFFDGDQWIKGEHFSIDTLERYFWLAVEMCFDLEEIGGEQITRKNREI